MFFPSLPYPTLRLYIILPHIVTFLVVISPFNVTISTISSLSLKKLCPYATLKSLILSHCLQQVCATVLFRYHADY
jgi:hypothetical protein